MKVQGEQKEDMRVTRTRRNIREAFLRASLDKSPDEMKISDLAKDADIARKTVYLHYKNTDEIADDICDRLTAEIIPKLTGDIANDIETIYTFFDNADEPIYKLLFGGYSRFRDRFFHEIFSSDAFSKWYTDPEYGFVVEGYLSCIPRMYDEYKSGNVNKANMLSTHELAVNAAELIMNGIEGISDK